MDHPQGDSATSKETSGGDFLGGSIATPRTKAPSLTIAAAGFDEMANRITKGTYLGARRELLIAARRSMGCTVPGSTRYTLVSLRRQAAIHRQSALGRAEPER